MIKNNIKDDDLLEHLLTSEFNEKYKPEEYKFLILKFRSFYKMIYGRQKQKNEELLFTIEQLEKTIKSLEERTKMAQQEKADTENILLKYSNKRKLTWKERFNGEIKKY